MVHTYIHPPTLTPTHIHTPTHTQSPTRTHTHTSTHPPTPARREDVDNPPGSMRQEDSPVEAEDHYDEEDRDGDTGHRLDGGHSFTH